MFFFEMTTILLCCFCEADSGKLERETLFFETELELGELTNNMSVQSQRSSPVFIIITWTGTEMKILHSIFLAADARTKFMRKIWPPCFPSEEGIMLRCCPEALTAPQQPPRKSGLRNQKFLDTVAVTSYLVH